MLEFFNCLFYNDVTNIFEIIPYPRVHDSKSNNNN